MLRAYFIYFLKIQNLYHIDCFLLYLSILQKKRGRHRSRDGSRLTINTKRPRRVCASSLYRLVHKRLRRAHFLTASFVRLWQRGIQQSVRPLLIKRINDDEFERERSYTVGGFSSLHLPRLMWHFFAYLSGFWRPCFPTPLLLSPYLSLFRLQMEDRQ